MENRCRRTAHRVLADRIVACDDHAAKPEELKEAQEGKRLMPGLQHEPSDGELFALTVPASVAAAASKPPAAIHRKVVGVRRVAKVLPRRQEEPGRTTNPSSSRPVLQGEAVISQSPPRTGSAPGPVASIKPEGDHPFAVGLTGRGLHGPRCQ